MMTIKTMDIILKKSNRKNAKSIIKTKSIHMEHLESKMDNLKKEFKKDDIFDILSFIIYNKKEYPIVTIRLEGYETQKRYSFEQVINDVYKGLQFLNLKPFQFTLHELHDNKNIKYCINQYYHGKEAI